tara:strand:+ start:1548 stop:3332 length:1785 start_codon:yes stop_codon:yes gene_type:complete
MYKDSFFSYFKIILFILCISIVAFISNPYSFGHSNHAQELPPILALIYGDLYSNDFAVQSFLAITPRYFWQLLIAFMVSSIGLGIDQSLMIIQIVSVISFVGALYAIALFVSKEGVISNNKNLGLYFIVAYISILTTMPLLSWGSKIFFIEAVPGTLAMGIAIWSIYFALKKNWYAAYLCSASAVLIHFLVGIYSGLVIFPLLLLEIFKKNDFFKFIICLTIWLTPALYIYLNMLNLEPEIAGEYSFFEIFGIYRVYSVWHPSSVSIFRWFFDLCYLICGLYSSWKLFKSGFNKHILMLFVSMIVVSVLGLFINIIFVEFLKSEFIGKLQLQRLIPFGHIGVFLLISLYAINITYKNFIGRFVKFCIVCLPLLTVILAGYNSLNAIATTVLTIFITFAIAFFFYRRASINNFFMENLVFLLFLLLFISFYFKHEFFEFKELNLLNDVRSNYGFFDDKSSHSDIARWLKFNTNKDELILTPPIRQQLSFLQLQSQRAVYFSDKNVPYTKSGVYEWANRLQKLTNNKFNPYMSKNDVLTAWVNNPSTNIQTLAKLNNICYLIDIQNVHMDLAGKIILNEVISNKHYSLWKLDYCNI